MWYCFSKQKNAYYRLHAYQNQFIRKKIKWFLNGDIAKKIIDYFKNKQCQGKQIFEYIQGLFSMIASLFGLHDYSIDAKCVMTS